MGEKLREHQICLKLNDGEYLILQDMAAKLHMKPTELLRMLIRAEDERLWLATSSKQ